MFEKLRRPGQTKNIVAVVLFGVICFVFIFLGVDRNHFGLAGSGPAAVVNQQQISYADYHERFTRLQNQYKAQFEKLPEAQRQEIEQKIKSRALEDLIDAEVVAQAATNSGIFASDLEVRDYILDIPFFHKDEKFNREYYNNYLSYRHVSAQKFEDEIRKELSRVKLRELISKTLMSTKLVKDLDAELGKRQINIEFLRLEKEQFKTKETASAAEVKSFVDDPKNESALHANYEANRSKYEQKEEVKARHILIKFDAAKAGDDKKALEKIEALSKKVTKENFAQIAKENSEDAGSKASGGDLGFFGRGKMVAEFENVAFSQEIGKISVPVKSAFGYHLILVEEKKPEKTAEFDEVKNQLAQDLLSDREYDVAVADLEKKLASGNSSEVQAWLKKYNLKTTETGLFKLDQLYIPKLGADEDLLREVLPLKSNGKYVSKLVLSQGSKYLLQLKELKEDTNSKVEAVNDALDMRQNRMTQDVFNLWSEDQKAKAVIKRNTVL